MKYISAILFFFLFNYSLNAQTISFFMENDVIDGQDKHYTNGSAFMYLSDNDTNNLTKYNNSFYKFVSKIPTFNNNTKYQSLGLVYSHLAFTPSNLKTKQKIIGDLPYAGVITIDFILYKWEEKFFHEYMLTLGMVGPSTKTQEFQSAFHKITGNTKPQGWDNQLKDDFLYNFAYAYGYKAYKEEFDFGKVDINHSIRFDVGNYIRSVHFGSMFRYGKNFPDNFNTVGRFIGSNEHKMLNLTKKKSYAWALSYGLAYTYTDFFYINDHDKSYQNKKLGDSITQILSFDTFYNDFNFSFNFKSSHLFVETENNAKESWGGISLTYQF